MKRLLFYSAIAFAPFAGCSNGAGNVDAGGDAGVVDMAATMRGPDLRVVHDMAMVTGSVQGLLLDETQKPVAATAVLACNPTVCKIGMTNPDGTFEVPGLMLGPLAVKTEEDRSAMPRVAAALAPVKVMEGPAIDLGKVYVPSMPSVTPLGAEMNAPQTLALGDGVSLTFVRKDLMPPLGADMDTFLGARWVPAERRAATLDVGGDTLVGAWAMMPFTMKSASKIGVSVTLAPNVVGLAPMSEVHFRSVNELDGMSSAPAIGHVSADGKTAATDPGQGVDNLTWLLLSK